MKYYFRLEGAPGETREGGGEWGVGLLRPPLGGPAISIVDPLNFIAARELQSVAHKAGR